MIGRPLQSVLLALCSWAVLCTLVWRTPVSLHFYDPVIQLRALQQYQRGDSPAWNVLRRVDPADLSKDLLEPVGWWPPAIPALVAPFAAAGCSLGTALRLVVIITGAAGAVGWALWWTRFALPKAWLFTLALLVPWLRPSSAGFFRFSGDNLAFAAAPWVFLGLLALVEHLRSERIGIAPLVLSGLAIGLAGAVKYSLAVAVIAAFLATACIVWMQSATRLRTSWKLAVLGFALLVVPIALKLCYHSQGASDPTGHSAPDNRTWSTALYAIANPALGLADAASPFYFVFVQSHALGSLSIANILAWTGLPGGLLLLWLLLKEISPARQTSPEALALLGLSFFTLLMIGLWFVSDATRDTRIFLPVTCAALPAVMLGGKRIFARTRPALRPFLLVAAGIYLVLPLAYGPVFVAAKIAGARNIITTPSGLHLPTLGVADQSALVGQLNAFATSDAVWIVPDPEIFLALPGRLITPLSGRSIGGDLANIYEPTGNLSHWRTRKSVELRVLSDESATPPAFAASIPGATGWLAHSLAGGQKTLWTARLEPIP